jgi:hypothetical protein
MTSLLDYSQGRVDRCFLRTRPFLCPLNILDGFASTNTTYPPLSRASPESS